MTEKILSPEEDGEPVSKRTRRAGIVASIGDPTLKDRSKVAPLFLSKKEKADKLYKKEQEKLAQSTKTRLNDWKSVIGVERDASRVCPVFHKASVASVSSGQADAKPAPRVSIADTIHLDPIGPSGIVPDPYDTPFTVPETAKLPPHRSTAPIVIDETRIDEEWRRVLVLDVPRPVDLSTPAKPRVDSPAAANEYPDIDKPFQTNCLAALAAMGAGKHPSESVSQLTDWAASNTRDWCAARLEPRKQHALSKWLAKWKDEDTAVRRNRVAPILLVSGPVGTGKTSLVYAAATELNIQVLEVSPSDFSWQSNGKRPMSEAVREALQSRQVRSEGLSQIVLVDDVDVLVSEDRSVLSALASMTDDSKRPLVLTCTNEAIVTGPGILDVTQIFRIDPVDSVSSSFIAAAYQSVLGKAGLARRRADNISVHTHGDLRRIAMASQMEYSSPGTPAEFFPASVYGIDLDADLFSNRERLLNVLHETEGLPIGLRDSGTVDILDCVHGMMNASCSLEEHMRLLGDLSFASCSAMDAKLGADIALRSAESLRGRLQEADWRHALVLSIPKGLSIAEALVEPFLTAREAMYVQSRPDRLGTTLHALGVMAQLSSASEFSSRRVRCVLDQFPAAVSEIAELRRIFPKPNVFPFPN